MILFVIIMFVIMIIIMFVIMIIFLIVDSKMKIMNQVIGSLVPLGLICLIVTFGNLLVISAVRYRSSLGIIIARYYHCQVFLSSGIIIVRHYHCQVLSSAVRYYHYCHRGLQVSMMHITVVISAIRYCTYHHQVIMITSQ